MSQQSEYMIGYNNGWADAVKAERETKKAKGDPGCLCCGEAREPAVRAANGRYVCAFCLVPAAK
jgi:hypothetical protein